MLKFIHNWLVPNISLQFDSAILSHMGGRDNLEDFADYILAEGQQGCWALADGVGGQGAGEVAAQLAIETVIRAFQNQPVCSQEALLAFLKSAHQAVVSAREVGHDRAHMASTVVTLLSDGRHAVWGHVGDSRLYFFRADKIVHRSEDQSLVNMLLARGVLTEDNIHNFAQRHVILHALGQDNLPEFSIHKPVTIKDGDGFLLCSDGVWELVSDAELLASWQASSSAKDWIRGLEKLLLPRVAEKNAAGEAADNFSAVVVKVYAAQK